MPVLSLKVGSIEISYDGDQEFIETGLLKLLKELAALPIAAAPPPTSSSAGQGNGSASAPSTGSGSIGHSTSQIAHVLGVHSGGDLALAAAAHLILAKSQEQISRADILAEMKGATSFVTASYMKNLTPILSTMVKSKKLTPISKDRYSMPNAVRAEIISKIGNE